MATQEEELGEAESAWLLGLGFVSDIPLQRLGGPRDSGLRVQMFLDAMTQSTFWEPKTVWIDAEPSVMMVPEVVQITFEPNPEPSGDELLDYQDRRNHPWWYIRGHMVRTSYGGWQSPRATVHIAANPTDGGIDEPMDLYLQVAVDLDETPPARPRLKRLIALN